MADTFSCPECGVLLRRSPALRPGMLVKCPKCTHQFRVPDDADAPALPSLELDDAPPPIRRAAPPPGPDSPFAFEDSAGGTPPPRTPERDSAPPPRRERAIDDDDEDRPRGREFDFEEEDEDRPRRRGRLETLPTDHAVDIGGSYRLAWSCWGEFVGPAIGFVFAAALVMIPFTLLGMIPIVGPFLYLGATIVLMRGPQLVALRVVRGKGWTFNDFFGGVGYLGHILGLAFFQGTLLFVVSIPVLLVLALASMTTTGSNPNGEEIVGAGMLGAGLVGLLLHLYLDARLFTFAIQLVVHKRLGVVEAMRGCWHLSEGRALSFIGVNVLFALTAVSGLAVCVGTLATVPLAHLFVASAYARIMGVAKTDDDSPRERRPRREYDDDDRSRRRRAASQQDDY